MHSIQNEMMVRVELDDRRREARPRSTSPRSARRRVGALLVGVGARVSGAGQRLQRAGTCERPEPALRSAG